MTSLMGLGDLGDLAPEEIARGLSRTKAVSSILTPRAMGTGFVVVGADGLWLVTASYVWPSRDVARRSLVKMNWITDGDDIFWVTPRPDRGFQVDSDMDVAACRIEIPPERASWVQPLLASDQGTEELNEPVFVVQHPQGRRMQVGVGDTKPREVRLPHQLVYATDRAQSSPGAPVFDHRFYLLGVHTFGECPSAERTVAHRNWGVRWASLQHWFC